jgi:hypothetical protein
MRTTFYVMCTFCTLSYFKVTGNIWFQFHEGLAARVSLSRQETQFDLPYNFCSRLHTIFNFDSFSDFCDDKFNEWTNTTAQLCVHFIGFGYGKQSSIFNMTCGEENYHISVRNGKKYAIYGRSIQLLITVSIINTALQSIKDRPHDAVYSTSISRATVSRKLQATGSGFPAFGCLEIMSSLRLLFPREKGQTGSWFPQPLTHSHISCKYTAKTWHPLALFNMV